MKSTDFELRPWRLSDAPSLAGNANSMAIYNNLRDAFPHPYTVEDGLSFIRRAMSIPDPATLMAIVVDGYAAGSIGITPRADVERITAEIGYFIGEKYWNKGIMTEALKAMTDYAFTRFPLLKLYATPFDYNIASQRVLQKAGYELEAVLKRGAIKNGSIVDLHYYSILK